MSQTKTVKLIASDYRKGVVAAHTAGPMRPPDLRKPWRRAAWVRGWNAGRRPR